MDWYYSNDGKQTGPIDRDEFQSRIEAGEGSLGKLVLIARA